MRSAIKLLALIITTPLVFHYFSNPVSAETITVNQNTTYQTMSGWEGVSEIGSFQCPYLTNTDTKIWNPAYINSYKDAITSSLANDLGINRIRFKARSGFIESDDDYFTKFLNAQIDLATFRSHYHISINDDADPFSVDTQLSINPNTTVFNNFYFSEMDHNVEYVVEPLKKSVQTNGQELYINLQVGANKNALLSDNPEEYAEFILAIFKHLDNKYAWVPDSVEIVNEPTLAKGWSAQKIADNIIATSKRLANYGYAPEFIAPATRGAGLSHTEGAVRWLNDMITHTNGDILNYLNELSYHRYRDINETSLTEVRDAITTHNLRSAQLEKFDGGGHALTLLKDLKWARVSAWQQFTLAYCTVDNGAQYYVIQLDTDGDGDGWPDDPNKTTFYIANRSKFLRQYFKFVKLNAQRISATTPTCSDDDVCGGTDPVAFMNPDGGIAVVIKTSGAKNLSITGLPAGTYGIKYTTGDGKKFNPGNGDEYDVDLPDQTITSGAQLSTNIPKNGVITIYQKPGGTPLPTPTNTPTLPPTNTPIPPTPPPLPGDLDGDNDVDIFDYNQLVGDFGKTGNPGFIPADIDKDGVVGIFDYNLLIGNFTG